MVAASPRVQKSGGRDENQTGSCFPQLQHHPAVQKAVGAIVSIPGGQNSQGGGERVSKWVDPD